MFLNILVMVFYLMCAYVLVGSIINYYFKRKEEYISKLAKAAGEVMKVMGKKDV